MTCAEAIEFLADYIAHELDAERLAAFERHLSKCHACVAYLETYRETIRMAKAAAASQAGAEMPEELMEAIRSSLR